MLIERPDLIDRFANHFVSDTDQNWYFRPREDLPPLPVSEGEIIQGVERYRRRSAIAMWLAWVMFFAAFLWFCWTGYSGGGQAIGLEHVITFPLAFLIGFAAHAWAGYSSIKPFQRRLLEYAAVEARLGKPLGPGASEVEVDPWISISANRGGCILLSAMGLLAIYGVLRLFR